MSQSEVIMGHLEVILLLETQIWWTIDFGPFPIADLLRGGGRGHNFYFTGPPYMFNSPYFDPYLYIVLVSITLFDLRT